MFSAEFRVPTKSSAEESTTQKPPTIDILAEEKCKIAFALGRSAHILPKTAAAEAFNMAAVTLGDRCFPNLCILHCSVDHSGMLESPEIVWGMMSELRKKAIQQCNEDKSKPTPPPTLALLGGAVRNQKFQTGHVEVLLGHIPDLQTSTFTLDQIPQSFDVSPLGQRLPTPFLGIGFIDWALASRHQGAVDCKLHEVSAKMNLKLDRSIPFIGGVYPPAEADGELKPGAGGPQESYFFINDNVYRGAAAGVVLHSDLVRAHCLPSPPSVILQRATITESTFDGDLLEWIIRKIDDTQLPTDVVRELYERTTTQKSIDPVTKAERSEGVPIIPRSSKLLLAVHLPKTDDVVPLSFSGDPNKKTLKLVVPPALAQHLEDATKSGSPIEAVWVRDDAPSDTEALASEIIAYAASCDKETNELRAVVRQPVELLVEREGRKAAVKSNSCGLHWSYPGLYAVALGLGSNRFTAQREIHAPNVASRCLQDKMPCIGAHVPGQIFPMVGAKSSCIATRSSVQVFLREVNSR